MPSHRHTLTFVLVALAALLLGNLFPVSGVLAQGGQPPLVAPEVPASPPPPGHPSCRPQRRQRPRQWPRQWPRRLAR